MSGKRNEKGAYLHFLLYFSLSSLAAEKATLLRAGILMASPVAGLRPVRALSWRTWNLPKPGTLTPLLMFDLTASKTSSVHARASFRLTSFLVAFFTVAATSSTNWLKVSVFATKSPDFPQSEAPYKLVGTIANPSVAPQQSLMFLDMG